MLAVVEDFDAVSGVAGGIGGDEDGLDAVVFDEFLEGGVGFLATAGPGQCGTSIGEQIADGDDLDVGVVLEAEGGAETAYAVADDADANPAIGQGLPAFGCIGISGCFFKTLDR